MKLAIVIKGEQNSGKTTTIRELIRLRGGKNISRIKRGFQRLILDKKLICLKLDVFCIPSSPSEQNNPLSNQFPNWKPDVLLVAEQPNGRHFKNTYDFLKENHYEILKFTIHNQAGDSIWERFNNDSKDVKLRDRVTDIIYSINDFVKTEIYPK